MWDSHNIAHNTCKQPLLRMITADPSDINVLVVDDEEDVVEVVSHFLEQEGYTVHKAYDGQEALQKASAEIDLIVLDVMMPGADGYEVCRTLRSRAETETIPIIFLSAKIEEEDQVKGLMLGGDDYLTKPASPQVILAHVKAVLRRMGVDESRIIQVQNLSIYEDEYRAALDEKDLGLTLTEFELLRYLVRHPRKAFTPPTIAGNNLERRYDGDRTNRRRPHQKFTGKARRLRTTYSNCSWSRIPIRRRRSFRRIT